VDDLLHLRACVELPEGYGSVQRQAAPEFTGYFVVGKAVFVGAWKALQTVETDMAFAYYERPLAAQTLAGEEQGPHPISDSGLNLRQPGQLFPV